jgi:hypothetical protein
LGVVLKHLECFFVFFFMYGFHQCQHIWGRYNGNELLSYYDGLYAIITYVCVAVYRLPLAWLFLWLLNWMPRQEVLIPSFLFSAAKTRHGSEKKKSVKSVKSHAVLLFHLFIYFTWI